jgi:hypothetical protein
MSPPAATSVVVRIDSDLRFADEALRSVTGQQKSPGDSLEIIVLATRLAAHERDVLEAMIASLAHTPLQVVDAGDAHGASAWMRGIAECSGDVVALLDGRDRFHPERLFRVRQTAPATGDWIACSAIRFIDALGDDARKDAPLALAHQRALLDSSRFPSVGFALLRQNLAQTVGNLVFTRTLLQAVGGLDSEDDDPAWGLLLAALDRVEPILLPDPLLERRDLGRPKPASEDGFRFDSDDEAAAALRRRRLDQWLERICDRVPANPLAPCSAHWPVYFDLFVSRADPAPRDDEARPTAAWRPPEASTASSWQSWADVIDFGDVDGRDFATSAAAPAAERSALALAQAVLQARRGARREEGDALAKSLSQAYDAHIHPGGAKREAPPWPAIERVVDARGDAREVLPAERSPHGLRGLAPMRWLSRLRQHLYFRRMIRDSGLFDVRGYRAQCRERGLFVIDPISHFLRGADSHHLDPHPLFHTRYYLQRNPDVRGQVNPLLHYLLAGDAEGRRPHWLFDPTWYRMKHADVDESKQNALIHFVHQGVAEGRRGHPRQDLVGALYRATLPDGRGRWRRFIDEAARGAEGANLRIAAREALAESDRAQARGEKSIEDRRRSRRQAERLRRSPLFDAGFHSHWFGADLDRGGDAARRFLEHAAIEGVGFVGLDRVHDELERLADRFDDPSCPELGLLHRATQAPSIETSKDADVTLYVSSKGNLFFQEMAELLAHGFGRAGARVTIQDESAATPGAPPARGEHRIVIAPHEFFLLGDGPKRLSRGFLETTSLWLAEQPGSEFFAMGIWFAQFARRVLDVNPLSALAWGALGFEARALPLGHTTGFADYADALEIEAPHVRRALRPGARPSCAADAPLRERPIDVSFNGVLTDRRERFFARHAPVFSELECALFMPSPATPVSVRLASSLTPHDATALSQRSKILLNVHRGETGYFEWHRLVVRGLWQRALVVSETSMPVPGLEPGVHYVEADLDELPERIDWLLRSEAGQAEAEQVRTAGFEAFRARYPLEALCAAFLADDASFDPIGAELRWRDRR